MGNKQINKFVINLCISYLSKSNVKQEEVLLDRLVFLRKKGLSSQK